jgi:benzoyl-CoA reductase subunit BamC
MKKRMRIDHIKCTGCRECETACSIQHYENEVNPKKSRIRVFLDDEEQKFFPVISGPSAEAECTSKYNVIIAGNDYDECTLCRAACPSRTWFLEPDTGIALKCDFCGEPPDPHCVKACTSGALTVIEI